MSEWVDAPTGPGRWWRRVGNGDPVLCDVAGGDEMNATRVDGLEVLYSARPFAGVKWRRDVTVSADDTTRLRALLRESTGLALRLSERAERAEARVAELEAILAGRTTPPTDAEIAEHWRAGGTWVVEGVIVLRSAEAARSHRDQTSWAAVPWVPMRDGRPCAWPAEVSRG